MSSLNIISLTRMRWAGALVVLIAAEAARPATGPGPAPASGDPAPVAHTMVLLRPRYDPPGLGLERRDSARLTLTLLPQGDGLLAWTGRYGRVAATAVRWTRSGNRFDLAPGSLGSIHDHLLSWEAWTLELMDRDGDGVLDSGAGVARGEYQLMAGDVMDFAHYDATLEATPDTTAPSASLAFPREPIPLPVDTRVEVVFSEPVAWTPDGLKVLAGGALVPSRVSPTGLLLGFASGALLELEALVPFGAALTLDPGGLADGGGRAASWDGDTLRTPSDPGPLAANGRPLAGLAGWIADGRAGAFPDSAHDRLRVESGGSLIGYLDVPDDAVALEIEAEFFSEIGEYDTGLSGVIDLIAAGTRARVFDVSGAEQGGSCACSPYGHTTGPLQVRADLVPFRGKRVLLTFAARSSGYLGMNEYAIDVRRVRLVR